MSLCFIALESDVNLPDLAVREDGWEVESLIVPCDVLLVWNLSTSRQGWGYCSKVGGHCLVDSSKFKWSFFLNIWHLLMLKGCGFDWRNLPCGLGNFWYFSHLWCHFTNHVFRGEEEVDFFGGGYQNPHHMPALLPCHGLNVERCMIKAPEHDMLDHAKVELFILLLNWNKLAMI